MALNIDIKDESISQFSDHAKEELSELLSKHAEKIISESARIEAEQRDQNEAPDIGRGTVREASIIINRYRQNQKTKWWVTIARLISPITGVSSGFLFKPSDFATLSSPLIFFLVSLGFFLISTTISVFLGGSNE